MSNLQTHYDFKIDFQKVETYRRQVVNHVDIGPVKWVMFLLSLFPDSKEPRIDIN